MRQIVVGTFDQQDSARAAIVALANARFDPRRVHAIEARAAGGAAGPVPPPALVDDSMVDHLRNFFAGLFGVGHDVTAFAQRRVDGHGKAGAERKGLAEQKGVKVSDTPTMVKKAEIKMLSERKGSSFDQHYADSIGVKAHEDTIKLFQQEVDKGSDPDVKAWAAKTLPALQHHLEAAQALKAKTDAEPKS